MKKIVLSVAAVMAAAAFAPEASAVPVFARQTGMACSACHFQHFPLLNGFGRAFKSAGFTMIGTGKVEGEHLDIPANLNLGVLTTTGYEKSSNSAANMQGGQGVWFVPASGGELSIFFGGRVSEFAGFLSELGLGKKVGGTGIGAAKLAMMFPVGDARVGLVAHTSGTVLAGGGQGVAYSYETLNTGAVNTHKMTAVNGAGQSHTNVYSAAQFLGTNTAATGLSLVAANDNMGFINIGKWDAAPVGTGNAGTLPLTYVRAAALFNAAGFDMGAGVQNWGGTSQASTAAAAIVAKATVIDFQAQGEVSGMGLGLYASYGTAPATVTAVAPAQTSTNLFNAGASKKSSFNIGAELGVIPGVATVQLAFRSGNSGANELNALGAAIAGTNAKSNAFQIGGTYELAQNIELSLTHSANSGSFWNANPVTGVQRAGKTVTTVMMEALF